MPPANVPEILHFLLPVLGKIMKNKVNKIGKTCFEKHGPYTALTRGKQVLHTSDRGSV